MSLRLLLLTTLTGCFIASASAQDRIYKKDGSMEEVKIKEVGTRTLVYKKWNNQDGPDFVIAKSEVSRVRFQNGDEESFDRHDRMRPLKEKHGADLNYGKNILAFSPIHMTNTSVTGVGLSYERVLSRNNVLSFYLPVAFSFKNNNDRNYYGTGYDRRYDAHVFWAYPGIKIYPTGSDGKVRYAAGASLAFGAGSNTVHEQVYDPLTGGTMYSDRDHDVFVMGLLVNNSLNVYPSPHLRIGLELGLGIPYYYEDGSNDVNSNYYYSSPYDGVPLVQFNFNIGYRF